jgi:signal transduction histidine kinase
MHSVVVHLVMAAALRRNDQLSAIAAALADRRDAILRRWREAADADPELTTASALSRAQFHDHIPEVLDAFERRLQASDRNEREEAVEDQREGAVGHGLVRWQQGYQQRELMREWRHLHLLLVDELENIARSRPDIDAAAWKIARRELAQLASDGVCESATQYSRLQQVEAAGRLRDLEQAVADLGRLQSERAEIWREAAHDLRGSLGVLHHVTAALRMEDAPQPLPAEMVAIMRRGVASMHALLDDLISLARLEAGQERRQIEAFDAGATLQDLGATMQPFAEARRLALVVRGPPTLRVEGDPVKIRRIAQNLLLNALKYTARGGVVLTWDEAAGEGAPRWVLCVQDTGPGLDARVVPPIAQALKSATDEAQAVSERAEESGEPSAEAQPAPLLASQSAAPSTGQPPGEGIGLAIVKRLCELLDATVELHTEPGKGSTFRVIFPRHYPSGS